MATTKTPLDVWLKFDTETHVWLAEDLATYEANTYATEDGFTVEWYHNAVGQVSSRDFETYSDATKWLESEGFQDFSF